MFWSLKVLLSGLRSVFTSPTISEQAGNESKTAVRWIVPSLSLKTLCDPQYSVSYIIPKYRIVNADVRMHRNNDQYTSLSEWYDMAVKRCLEVSRILIVNVIDAN